MSEETKTPPSSIAACYDTRADEARAILFPEAQGGISDDAYYNLMGLQYDMEHATPKDEVGIRTIKRVLDQLNRASNVLARKPVSANAESKDGCSRCSGRCVCMGGQITGHCYNDDCRHRPLDFDTVPWKQR